MRKKRILSIVLTLTMLLGMLPAMSLTASAAGETKEITPTNTSGTMTITLTIPKKNPTAPTGLTATYGQTLADVTLPDGWTWVDSTQSVGNVVSPATTFKANFAGDNNYNAASNVDVAVTVSKAANPATVANTATVTKGGKTINLAGNVTLNGATGAVTYAISGNTNGCTLNGSVLTSGDNAGSVTVNVTVAEDNNYNALDTKPINVTISDKDTQTITASDVTASYGDTSKKFTATTSGNGTISYAVKSGSEEYIDIDAATGALTIKKIGTAIVIITAAETGEYAQATKEVTVTINKASAVAATVTANNRTYDGMDKPLVNVTGTATGGTMQYVLGSNATNAPTENWSTTIPTGKDAKTYFVWYKAKGDDTHNDSAAACVKVTIASPPPPPSPSSEDNNNGNEQASDIGYEVEQEQNTPKSSVEVMSSELAKDLMTDEEKTKVAAGEDATMVLEIKNVDSTVSQNDKSLTENVITKENSSAKVAMYLDFSLFLKVGDSKRQLSNTGEAELTILVDVPTEFIAPAGVKRTFFITRIHNNVAVIIARSTSNRIPVKSGLFSTYALGYVDEPIEKNSQKQSDDTNEVVNAVSFNSGLKITQKNGKMKVSWDKTSGAFKYEVYANYCGDGLAKKPVKTTKSNSVTFKKLKGKKIDFTKNFTVYVKAYDANGKYIGKTVNAHFAGKDSKKYKNPKKIKLSTKSISLNKGQSAKIMASVKMEKGKKKAFSESHVATLRYRTSNSNVATVDKNGTVTAVNPGNCTVYVYAKNGLAKKVTVTVN